MTQYVQHKSGVGAKWKVLDIATVPMPVGFHGNEAHEWYVQAQASNLNGCAYHILPKSEYQLLLDEWVNVPASKMGIEYGRRLYHNVTYVASIVDSDYRFELRCGELVSMLLLQQRRA